MNRYTVSTSTETKIVFADTIGDAVRMVPGAKIANSNQKIKVRPVFAPEPIMTVAEMVWVEGFDEALVDHKFDGMFPNDNDHEAACSAYADWTMTQPVRDPAAPWVKRSLAAFLSTFVLAS